MPVTTRAVIDDDRPFLLDLYCATRADEFAALGADPQVVRALLVQQYGAREAGWAMSSPGADDLVILLGDDPVGRLVLERRADGIRIVDLAVAPAEQGKGIGTSVLRRVLDEADAVRVPVTLHVVADNPARRLYERCGFVPVPGNGSHVLMTCPPTNRAAAQPNTAT
ncbi:MAG TPA: GNAT family N-acetyltransferase [Arachnia sp.]|nr:GNAT family N-acetyltransferase [Arachnia sp.]